MPMITKLKNGSTKRLGNLLKTTQLRSGSKERLDFLKISQLITGSTERLGNLYKITSSNMEGQDG